MIRIAIVEDESSHVQILEEYLKRFEQENQITFRISVFPDGLDIVTDYRAEYDIILLDIQMKHLDGMKTAEKIREMDEDVAFIFITSTVQYAVQGYLVDALGYVVKPVSYIAFSQILKKAVRQASGKHEKSYLKIEVEGGYLRIGLSQIFYIESQRHNIVVHSKKGDFLTAGPMKRMESELSDSGFAKCHNAYLVNLSNVTGILQNNVLVEEDVSLPLSRTRKKAFMDALTDYMGGMRR